MILATLLLFFLTVPTIYMYNELTKQLQECRFLLVVNLPFFLPIGIIFFIIKGQENQGEASIIKIIKHKIYVGLQCSYYSHLKFMKSYLLILQSSILFSSLIKIYNKTSNLKRKIAKLSDYLLDFFNLVILLRIETNAYGLPTSIQLNRRSDA